MKKRKLVSKRVRGPKGEDDDSREKPFHPLYGHMEGLLRIMPGVDITQPAVRNGRPGSTASMDPRSGRADCGGFYGIPVRPLDFAKVGLASAAPDTLRAALHVARGFRGLHGAGHGVPRLYLIAAR